MRLIIILLQFLILTTFPAQSQAVKVFRSGKEGHKSFRVPAIIRLPDGQILAFAEGRVTGINDFGDINIVLKRSRDNGKTWGPISTVVDYEKLHSGNPAPVVDLTDPLFPGGRIFLFYNTGNNFESEIRKGKGYREVWYKTSSDGGNTWSDPVNITTQVHKPFQPAVNPAYNFKEDWRSYANTPGHAMQFTSGLYRGRILVAANHSKGDPDRNWEDYASHAFYTDDHGNTFKLSQTLKVPGSSEATAAEISGNGLILNARNQKGDIKSRIVAFSKNGGETWDSLLFDNYLLDPVCEGSILTLGEEKGKYILAFCNPASIKYRDNLTVRISYDDGRTWTSLIQVDRSSNPQNSYDYSAYSDIVSIALSELGVLYERNNYSEIVFKVIRWR
jgi:sialidase-1